MPSFLSLKTFLISKKLRPEPARFLEIGDVKSNVRNSPEFWDDSEGEHSRPEGRRQKGEA